jgi:hypothetical protein
MSVPEDQITPFPGADRTPANRDQRPPGSRKDAAHEPPRPHLFGEELCRRWGINASTLSRTYRKLGLRPIKLGKKLLFPLNQVEEAEANHMK